MWRQSSPEISDLRHAIRRQIKKLLRMYYGQFQAEGMPQRFSELLCEANFVEQNDSDGDSDLKRKRQAPDTGGNRGSPHGPPIGGFG
jgi:hypothetical protein